MEGKVSYREALKTGLLAGHWNLYVTSTTFHSQVDTLISLLPAWVDGLAETARRTDRELVRLTKQLEAGNFTPERDVPTPIESQEA